MFFFDVVLGRSSSWKFLGGGGGFFSFRQSLVKRVCGFVSKGMISMTDLPMCLVRFRVLCCASEGRAKGNKTGRWGEDSSARISLCSLLVVFSKKRFSDLPRTRVERWKMRTRRRRRRLDRGRSQWNRPKEWNGRRSSQPRGWGDGWKERERMDVGTQRAHGGPIRCQKHTL